MDDNEQLCDCGKCKYCKAFNSSGDDYQGENYLCSRCNGGGCTACEE